MKYEYKIYAADQGVDSWVTEHRLNELGQQGWELIFLAYSTRKEWPVAYYHFKRPYGVPREKISI